jgi:hypothetical protein
MIEEILELLRQLREPLCVSLTSQISKILVTDEDGNVITYFTNVNDLLSYLKRETNLDSLRSSIVARLECLVDCFTDDPLPATCEELNGIIAKLEELENEVAKYDFS